MKCSQRNTIFSDRATYLYNMFVMKFESHSNDNTVNSHSEYFLDMHMESLWRAGNCDSSIHRSVHQKIMRTQPEIAAYYQKWAGRQGEPECKSYTNGCST